MNKSKDTNMSLSLDRKTQLKCQFSTKSFNLIALKNHIFIDLDKIILKLYRVENRTRIAHTSVYKFKTFRTT